MNNILTTLEKEIDQRLEGLDLNKRQLTEVMRRAITAKFSAVKNHPQNTPGTYAYHEGVRAMRDLIADGKIWSRKPENGIEYIENREKKIRMVFQNVDYACNASHDPQPISQKGTASRNAVSSNQLQLFEPRSNKIKPSVWFLCVSENNGVLNVELSLPSCIDESGNFKSYIERIFVSVNYGAEERNNNGDSSADDYNDDFEISIRSTE